MKLNRVELASILDITDPFLMIDEAVEVYRGKSAHAIKVVKFDEWFMRCHLTKAPVMPGVLQAEVMLQSFVLPILLEEGHGGQQSYLKKFDVTLHKKIALRDEDLTLHAMAIIVDSRRGIYRGNAELILNDEVMASMVITMVSPHAMPVPSHTS